MPVASSAIVTEPMPDAVSSTVMPTGRLASDTKRIMHYFRRLPDGRFFLGGRGDLQGRDRLESFQELERGVTMLFPQLTGVKTAFRWSGKVAVTLDDFPHLGRVGSNILFAMGYGGRGVALTNLLGKYVAPDGDGATRSTPGR